MSAPHLTLRRRGIVTVIESDWFDSPRRLSAQALRLVSNAAFSQGALSVLAGEAGLRVRTDADSASAISARLRTILAAPGSWRATAVRKRFAYARVETRGHEYEPFNYELGLSPLPENVCDEPMNENSTATGTNGSACEANNPRLLLLRHVPNLSATKPNREMLHHV